MKKYTTWSEQGYSIIAAIMMIGFLLVLTTSTLNLVLQEMHDGKGRQDYIKAFAGAEGAMELGLLQIKKHGYWYYEVKTDMDTLTDSTRTIDLDYSFDSKVSSYQWTLSSYDTDIIPLFYIDALWKHSARSITLTAPADMTWNIVWSNGGLSSVGSFAPATNRNNKVLDTSGGWNDFDVLSVSVENFLTSNPESYLVLYNPDSSAGEKNYELHASSWEFFSKPISTIFSTAQVGKYSQNLKTQIDNTQFLGILRYSIYSWN